MDISPKNIFYELSWLTLDVINCLNFKALTCVLKYTTFWGTRKKPPICTFFLKYFEWVLITLNHLNIHILIYYGIQICVPNVWYHSLATYISDRYISAVRYTNVNSLVLQIHTGLWREPTAPRHTPTPSTQMHSPGLGI